MVRLNPAIYKNKRRAHRLASHFLLAILVLLATVFLIPHLAAESAAPQPAGQQFRAAIPKERPAGPGSREELAKGKFLVASRRLQDSNFRETVVLLIDYGLDGAMGLVINRPSTVKLATVFPDIKELKQRKDTIYVGGPVAVNQMLMLIRSSKVPEDATAVAPDVYIDVVAVHRDEEDRLSFNTPAIVVSSGCRPLASIGISTQRSWLLQWRFTRRG